MASLSRYSDMTNLALTKLCLAADYYAEVSPAVARFFTDKVERMKEEFSLPPTANHLRCQFCGAVFRPDNHRSHVKAQMKETKKIQQLLRHQETPGHELGRFQRRLLDLYANRKNRLTIVCDVCNKRTRVWFPGDRERGTKGTCEEITVPDMTKLSRSAKKKRKKKRKKQQSEGGPIPLDTVQLTVTSTFSTPLRSSESQIRSTLSSGSQSTPHSTKSHAASSQSNTIATMPSGGPARNKKKRNKQSYNPLKEMLERQSTDKSKTSGKGIMDLLMNINK